MHLNHLPPSLATLLFLVVQQCAGFTIDVKPEAADGNCRVSQNLFANIDPARGDPQVVDIFLFDGSVNKEVPLSIGARLDPKGSSFTFTVPQVPPGYPFAVRLKRPNSEQLLQDSSPFPIFPTLESLTSRLSATVASTTFIISSTTGSSFATEATTSIPIDQSATSPTAPPPRPITAILGPVFGVLSFFALCVAGCLWLWRRCRIKRRKARQQQVLSNMERATVTRSVAKQPYVTLPSASSSELPIPKDLEAGSKEYAISSDLKGSSSSKSRRFSHNSLFPESSPSSPAASSQPEMLKKERARVYEEIAALERRSELLQSSSNPFADPGSDITTRDILQQLTALKTRIQELEDLHAREQSRLRPASGSSSADPPPEYVPSRSIDHVPAHDGNSKTQCFCASCT
ncbi:unnamed protein product [Cyclocybe aegerita]|uniref:Uncharacterized protein n=1 Tax=Cyclocybe aegerita TaxID=1973307 RepID=A0A8S0VZM9_CYCAE|nr:unnamed protein product [Cyclocybe aegerita]